jgi:hypothetical protein
MPVTYSGPTDLLSSKLDKVEEILERAGLMNDDFLVGVAGLPGSDHHEVMIVNLDHMRSRVYRLDVRWDDAFAHDVANGVFAGECG